MQFVENLLSRKVKKKVILVQPGDICHESYFDLSGCLASYVIDASGKEHILQFAKLDQDYEFAEHPYFGLMDRKRWIRLADYHLDHHLKQFGV